MKKFPALLCLVLSANVMADNCPAVATLKNHHAVNWQAYDSDNHKPLSKLRGAQLRREIQQFAMAEWASDANRIHCYYRNADGSNMEAYFAKESSASVKPSKYWYSVTGMMHCAASTVKCSFETITTTNQHQLAQNDIRRHTAPVLNE